MEKGIEYTVLDEMFVDLAAYGSMRWMVGMLGRFIIIVLVLMVVAGRVVSWWGLARLCDGLG